MIEASGRLKLTQADAIEAKEATLLFHTPFGNDMPVQWTSDGWRLLMPKTKDGDAEKAQTAESPVA